MNNRGTSNLLKIIILGAVVAFLIVLAVTAPPSSSRGTIAERPNPKYRFTITANQVTAVMLDSVKVTNENTGESIDIFYNNLPETLNFAPGDVLSFNVTAKTGYTLNAWIFDDGTFSNSNPVSIKPRGTLSMDIRMKPLR